MSTRVLIRGGGEMATGVAAALFRAGIRPVLAEIEAPRAIRRTVSFAEAVRLGRMQVEGITAMLTTRDNLSQAQAGSCVPVVVDPTCELRFVYHPEVLVDATMSKRNAGGTRADWAPLVIGLGPGFSAPQDCHVVVETQRGHFLGRFYDRGGAAPDTGVPAELAGFSARRVVRSPVAGTIEPLVEIGTAVREGERLARVRGVGVPAPISGQLRGLMSAGVMVSEGEKVGDIDPSGRSENCSYISDKARHIGLGVLAAILWDRAGRPGPLPAPPLEWNASPVSP